MFGQICDEEGQKSVNVELEGLATWLNFSHFLFVNFYKIQGRALDLLTTWESLRDAAQVKLKQAKWNCQYIVCMHGKADINPRCFAATSYPRKAILEPKTCSRSSTWDPHMQKNISAMSQVRWTRPQRDGIASIMKCVWFTATNSFAFEGKMQKISNVLA